ncbi:Adaptor protein complex sigma subunit [Suhomyces tanzawaensis NRRL Y-17324]|uniref:AP complex subunit sigma n=1 Tax=Suhomyces tanzawaensis NRRL Y-17324 TaxID=984487 RepID=A0A1E4SEI7_9ASCO|nr:Adaptor protein complex sigma subunit [Suhomyces tanzawaensis NRRL Y-17324]ODV77925.1 Adaptor protein complex sigma subunit [Suhomyces tanzawaensis NRRL Y-17324]
MSIHFLLVLNRQGKTRLIKWFNANYSTQEKQRYVQEIHRLIASRDTKNQSNFVEYQQLKLVYRRYAGLYFISAIDGYDSELSYLESLHFFVEILDTYFNNVCELDLVFNFYKLYAILDEVYLGGELQEILKEKVLERLAYLDKLD